MNQEIVTTEGTALTNPTPGQLLQMAVGQGADLDQLEKLMELQERWEAKEALKIYTIAVSSFRSKCPIIARTISGHQSKYAGLAESIEEIKPLLHAHGLSHSWRTDQTNGTVTVTCVLTHVSGHSERTSLSASPDDSGKKNPIQAIGSTLSYLERYTLYAILGLASKEMDNDGGDQEQYITEDQAMDLEVKIQDVGGDMKKFLKGFGIDSLEKLPADQLPRAVHSIDAKRTS